MEMPTQYHETTAVVLDALPADLSMPALPKNLPEMQAWWCLVQPYTPPTMSSGGIALTSTTQTIVKHNQYLAKIIAMGPTAFTSTRLVPENYIGRLPDIGDWVMINRLQGMTFEYQVDKYADSTILRVCADDAILAILPDPEGWMVGGV